MKKLRFEHLKLLSITEKKGLQIQFHPLITVIKGENDVGKSSVIKSLYWTFGASPPKIHPKWAKANIKALVGFSIDDNQYKILRNKNNYAIFDKSGKLLISTSQVTRELAPFLAELLNFNFVITNRDQMPEIPPPAYSFLPFYIDQDNGWRRPLDSFAQLSQYADFRKDLLEYHTGILPNEYYELSAQQRSLEAERRTIEADRNVVRKAIDRFRTQGKFDGLELSADGHEQAIEELLLRIQIVKQIRQERATKLADLLDQRMILNQQNTAVRAAIGEFEKDIAFAGKIESADVYCPTCGTLHQNDFGNKFSIIQEREACFDFLTDSKQKIRLLAEQARQAEAEVHDADHTLAEIQLYLASKRDEVTLVEVIESQGRQIAKDMFRNEIDELEAKAAATARSIADLDQRLAALRDKKRRDQIVSYFAQHMIPYLDRLDVTNYNHDDYAKIPAKIAETGSDLPRAILAYFLAIIQTIHNNSTSLFAPIVIDSPNQQDQDANNVAAMIKLIIEARPPDAQTILGTVSLHGHQIEEGSIIEFDRKLSVLREDEYQSVLTEMQPLLDQMAI